MASKYRELGLDDGAQARPERRQRVRRFELRRQLLHRPLVEREDDRVLGVEVVVGEPAGHTGARGDLAHGGLGEAALAEELERGLEDTGSRVLRRPVSTGDLEHVQFEHVQTDAVKRRATASPATRPDDQAHWKLKPPRRPSTSRISPTRYRPGHTRDGIVDGSISVSATPPAVTSA